MTTRLLAVQGPMQFIAGYLSMEWYRQVVSGDSEETKPILLLYDFLAPEEVEPEFVDIITRMASLREWRSVIFIGSNEMRKIMWRSYTSSTKKLRQIIGQDEFDEIYLARDHCGHGSPLIINAYKSAKRITYGDSLGWVENEPPVDRFNWQWPAASFLSFCKTHVRKSLLGGPDRLAFDAAVLTLPIVCSKGYLTGLPLLVPERDFVVKTIESMYEKLTDVTHLDWYCNALTGFAKGNICNLYLLSNFHRSGLMTVENEIHLYRDIVRETAEKGSYILLKAHPRGSYEVLNALVDQLQTEYETVAIDDVALSRIPIELWRGLIDRCVVIPVFSGSAVHLKYIYGKAVRLPLRDELVRKYFFKNRVTAILRANHIISQSVENLDTWDGKSMLFESRYQNSWFYSGSDDLPTA
jgi:hypothetical protein